MSNIDKRLRNIERELSPLYLIRKDLMPIREILDIMNISNIYNNSEKENIILDFIKKVKKIIIDLAEKYKAEV